MKIKIFGILLVGLIAWLINGSTVIASGAINGDAPSIDAAQQQPAVTPQTQSQVLTIRVEGSGTGTITSNPAGINCSSGGTGTCSFNFNPGTRVTLTATPSQGSVFNGFVGGGCIGTVPCVIALNRATTEIRAIFGVNRTLVFQRTGTGVGRVTSNPAGINCAEACVADFSPETSIRLTAAAEQGSVFTGWGGACANAGRSLTCNIIAREHVKVTANFNRLHSLTVNVVGSGRVSGTGISCPGDCAEGFGLEQRITLRATANKGYRFNGWGGACSGTGECVVHMTEARNVTATFNVIATPAPAPRPITPTPAPAPDPTLKPAPIITPDPVTTHPIIELIIKGNEFGHINVVGGGRIGTCHNENEMRVCPVTIFENNISLRATARDANMFVRWDGCSRFGNEATGIENRAICVIDRNQPRNITAIFEQRQANEPVVTSPVSRPQDSIVNLMVNIVGRGTVNTNIRVNMRGAGINRNVSCVQRACSVPVLADRREAVVLTPIPNEATGERFIRWEGDCERVDGLALRALRANSCRVYIKGQNREVTAIFGHRLRVDSRRGHIIGTHNGNQVINCERGRARTPNNLCQTNLQAGSVIELTINSPIVTDQLNHRWHLTRWEGCDNNNFTNNICRVTIDNSNNVRLIWGRLQN